MRLQRPGGIVGAGTRDRWVTIQTRPDDPTDGSGFPTDGDWADLATVAMHRDDTDASEVARNAQELAITTTRWEFPYRADCDPEIVDVPKLRRLLFHGRTFDIIAAVPIGRHRAIAFVTESHGKTPTEPA